MSILLSTSLLRPHAVVGVIRDWTRVQRDRGVQRAHFLSDATGALVHFVCLVCRRDEPLRVLSCHAVVGCCFMPCCLRSASGRSWRGVVRSLPITATGLVPGCPSGACLSSTRQPLYSRIALNLGYSLVAAVDCGRTLEGALPRARDRARKDARWHSV